jgi:hypothetical protein
LKYNRFYDWPPEPEYARVHASPPPRSTSDYQEDDEMDDPGLSGDEAFWFDPSLSRREKKKKKKKGLKRVASQAKKGAGAVVGVTGAVGGEMIQRTRHVGGAVVNTTKNTTMNVAKGTAMVTKKAVKGTTKVTKSAVKGAGNTVNKTGRVFGIRGRKKKDSYDEEDDGYY